MAPGFEFRIEQRVIDTNVEHPATSLFEIDGDVVKCVFEFGRETRGLGGDSFKPRRNEFGLA